MHNAEVIWSTAEMLYLDRFKEAGILNGMHSPFVKQMQIHGQQNRITPQN